MAHKISLALAVATAFAVPAAAQSAGSDTTLPARAGTGASRALPPRGTPLERHGRFDELDANHDGHVSRDEARDAEALQTRFSELDRDNDGKLTREEYDALHAERRVQGEGPAERAARGTTR
jgi:hypothetical protein